LGLGDLNPGTADLAQIVGVVRGDLGHRDLRRVIFLGVKAAKGDLHRVNRHRRGPEALVDLGDLQEVGAGVAEHVQGFLVALDAEQVVVVPGLPVQLPAGQDQQAGIELPEPVLEAGLEHEGMVGNGHRAEAQVGIGLHHLLGAEGPVGEVGVDMEGDFHGGFWFLVSGSWFLVPGSRFLVHDSKLAVAGR